MSNKLTIKQEKFCQLYIELGNASEAYRQAYDVRPDTKLESINQKAHQILNKVNIGLRIEELQKDTANKHAITRDDLLNMYLEIVNDSDKTFDLAKLKDADKEEKSRFFRMASVTSNGDKLRALDSIKKMLGFDEPEKVDVNVNFKTNWGK